MIKGGVLPVILSGYWLLRLPMMTPRERRLHKDLLRGLSDRPTLDIFEYGSGFSTLYFAKFLRSLGCTFHVHSVDHDVQWHGKIKSLIHQERLSGAVTPHLSVFPPWNGHLTEDQQRYIDTPRALGRTFDLIVVDGRFRRRCLEMARACLKPGGKVWLHDAERDFYHGSLGLFKNGKFLDGGRHYPFEPRKHTVWVGGSDD